uniref:Reverse transcriptase domain-containing protein n=1 Tax=Homalodisca liturata TaxID=320908 RepID=A0A1B6K603_9HEMI
MAYGAPQGSVLGPVLFLVYVNGLKSSLLTGKMVQCADNTTLCFKAKTKNQLEINTFLELNSRIQYFSTLNLRANSSKSNVLNFCLREYDSKDCIAVMVDDVLLEENDSTKFLGMCLDRGLTWDHHIESKFCSLDLLTTIYFGLLYPHITYCLRLWGSCSKYKFERVFRIQKEAVRIILKLKFKDSCNNFFRELELLTLPCLYILEVALYCRFKCELVQGRDVHQYGTRGRDNFRIQQHRTATFERLPSEVGVRFRNKLRDEIKNFNDPKKFKA